MKSILNSKLLILLILLLNKLVFCQVQPLFITSPVPEIVLKKNNIISINENKYFKDTGINEVTSEYQIDTNGKIIFHKYKIFIGVQILEMFEKFRLT